MHVREFRPLPPRVEGREFRLHVIFTTPETTQASLRTASELARDLGATLELLVPKVVPYPLPLHDPPAPAEFTEQNVSALAATCDVDVTVRVLLCRDPEETVPLWLPPESAVVIGRRRAWGPGSFRRLIRIMKRSGHHVIVVEAGARQPAVSALPRRQVRR